MTLRDFTIPNQNLEYDVYKCMETTNIRNIFLNTWHVLRGLHKNYYPSWDQHSCKKAVLGRETKALMTFPSLTHQKWRLLIG